LKSKESKGMLNWTRFSSMKRKGFLFVTEGYRGGGVN
jgi:hypothetical protein